MKAVLLLSRFTFICNIAFLLFVFFRWIEMRRSLENIGDNLVTLHFVKELVIILGFTAIIINLIMNIIYLIFLLRRMIKQLPMWLTVVNALFLLLQFYYFFLFNY